MAKTPKEALARLIKSSENSTCLRYKHVASIVIEQDLSDLFECVTERRSLSSCTRVIDKMSAYSFEYLCDKALPEMFEEEELEAYFLDCLIAMHADEATWTRRRKKELYEEITGSAYFLTKNRVKPLPLAFSNVYDNVFARFHRYPKQIEDRAVEAIRTASPLTSVYSEFMEKYHDSDHDSFMSWLSNCVLRRVGEEEFESYVTLLAERYANELPGSTWRYFTYPRMTTYIFGFSWMPLDKSNKFELRADGSHRDHYPLARILVKALLPYTIGATSRRGMVYDFLDLSEEERQAFEIKARRTDKSFVPAGMMVAGDQRLPEQKLAAAVEMEELFDSLNKFINETFLAPGAPRGPIPFSGKLKAEFKRWLQIEDEVLFAAYKEARRIPSLSARMDEAVETALRGLRMRHYEENAEEVQSDKQVIWLYFPKKGAIGGGSIDYSPISQFPEIHQYVKAYIRFLYNEAVGCANHRALESLPKTASSIIRALCFICKEYGVSEVSGITEDLLLAELAHESKKGKATGTLSGRLTSVKMFFKYLVRTGKLNQSPAENIRIKGTVAYHKATPEIPEDILAFIESHLMELRARDVRLFFKVAMETGWRASDIRAILTKDVIESCQLSDSEGTDVAEIKTRTSKTVASRIKHRLGDKLHAMVSSELHQEILDYIAETSYQRKLYDIDTVFFSISNGAKSDFLSTRVNAAINKLLNEHGIVSIDEGYDVFTLMQTRKTVAVELITSGAPPSAVQKQLGHVNPATTDRFYAQVRNKKLAELNNEFYKRKFGLLLERGQLDLYTEEERRILYVDFCTNRRNVELGVCSKHPSEGPCSSLPSMSCACCPKLCTGQAYKNRWLLLLSDSRRLLDEFVARYEKLGIPKEEYEDFTEYRQEKLLRERYESVLEAIERGTAG